MKRLSVLSIGPKEHFQLENQEKTAEAEGQPKLTGSYKNVRIVRIFWYYLILFLILSF